MMQLEFTAPAAGDMMPANPPEANATQTPGPASAAPVVSAPVVTAPPAPAPVPAAPPAPAPSVGGYAIDVSAVQARNLLHSAGAFVCVSFLTDPASMEQRHFLLLDHDLGGEPGDSRLLALPPQWRTGSVSGAPDPAWNETRRLTVAHPGIQASPCPVSHSRRRIPPSRRRPSRDTSTDSGRRQDGFRLPHCGNL